MAKKLLLGSYLASNQLIGILIIRKLVKRFNVPKVHKEKWVAKCSGFVLFWIYPVK